MKIVKLLYLAIARRYYRLACADKPMHPDIPKIVIRRVELADATRKLWA